MTLTVKQEEGDRRSAGFSQQMLGRLARAHGDAAAARDRYRPALMLYGDALRTAMNIVGAPVDQPIRERIATAGEGFGAADFERACAAGRAMTLVQAVEYALEDPPTERRRALAHLAF